MRPYVEAGNADVGARAGEMHGNAVSYAYAGEENTKPG